MRHFVSKFKEPQLGVAFTIETSVPSIPYFQFNSIKNSTKMQIAFISLLVRIPALHPAGELR